MKDWKLWALSISAEQGFFEINSDGKYGVVKLW